MVWTVELHQEFEAEMKEFDPDVVDEILSHVALLEAFGHQLGRPRVDTLKGSSLHNNLSYG